jgi:hypothetical protein
MKLARRRFLHPVHRWVRRRNFQAEICPSVWVSIAPHDKSAIAKGYKNERQFDKRESRVLDQSFAAPLPARDSGRFRDAGARWSDTILKHRIEENESRLPQTIRVLLEIFAPQN